MLKKIWDILVIIKEENVAIFRRYIAEISYIEGFRHDISPWNIGPAIFRDLSREIGDLSQYIGDLVINQRFFFDISRGQCGSTKVRPLQCPSTRYSDATVHVLQCLHICLLLRGFEPQTHPLTTWAKLPFDT